jgi:hypothetical protein
MKIARTALALTLGLLAACGDEPTAPTVSLIDETALTGDAAITAGHAMAVLVEDLVEHEDWAATSHGATGDASSIRTTATLGRTTRCYDAAGALINCLPFTPVRTIVTDGFYHATRSSQPVDGSTVAWSGTMHHTMNDTTTRVFTGTTETSRVHTGIEIGHDTTTFIDGLFKRVVAETAIDSVQAVTFPVPRQTRPAPVSGSIVRHVAAHVTIARENRSASHDFTRRVEVVFPADADGNVTLKIDATTCRLNLIRKTVSNCG